MQVLSPAAPGSCRLHPPPCSEKLRAAGDPLPASPLRLRRHRRHPRL